MVGGKEAAAAGSAFEAAVTLSESGKHQEAEEAFAKVAAEAPAGYRVLARLRGAAELAQIKPADAIKAYDEIAGDSSVGPTVQDLAAIRAGMIAVDSLPLAEMQRRLEPLAAPDRAFQPHARELLALSAWRNHDFAAASRYLDMIAGDVDTPPGVRTRADVLSALIPPAAARAEDRPHAPHEPYHCSAVLLALAPVLAGCDDFDMDKLDIFGLNEKRNCRASARSCFRSGVPGVTQGVPPEYMKGYVPPPDTTETPLPGAPAAVTAKAGESQGRCAHAGNKDRRRTEPRRR